MKVEKIIKQKHRYNLIKVGKILWLLSTGYSPYYSKEAIEQDYKLDFRTFNSIAGCFIYTKSLTVKNGTINPKTGYKVRYRKAVYIKEEYKELHNLRLFNKNIYSNDKLYLYKYLVDLYLLNKNKG